MFSLVIIATPDEIEVTDQKSCNARNFNFCYFWTYKNQVNNEFVTVPTQAVYLNIKSPLFTCIYVTPEQNKVNAFSWSTEAIF
jgi:hypothetical protein